MAPRGRPRKRPPLPLDEIVTQFRLRSKDGQAEWRRWSKQEFKTLLWDLWWHWRHDRIAVCKVLELPPDYDISHRSTKILPSYIPLAPEVVEFLVMKTDHWRKSHFLTYQVEHLGQLLIICGRSPEGARIRQTLQKIDSQLVPIRARGAGNHGLGEDLLEHYEDLLCWINRLQARYRKIEGLTSSTKLRKVLDLIIEEWQDGTDQELFYYLWLMLYDNDEIDPIELDRVEAIRVLGSVISDGSIKKSSEQIVYETLHEETGIPMQTLKNSIKRARRDRNTGLVAQ